MIAVDRKGGIQIQAKTSYMMRLFGADGFHLAEQWLREGPPAPFTVTQAVRDACSPDLLAANPIVGADEAIRACERLRLAGTVVDDAWVAGMQALFDQAPATRIALPTPVAERGVIADERRTNARPIVSVESIAA